MSNKEYIQKVLLNIKLERYDNIKKWCSNDEYKEDINNVINKLKQDIKNINNVSQVKQKVDSDIQERLSKMDDYIYKKAWSRLNIEQKKVKLLEYLDTNLLGCSNENIKELKKVLLEALKQKKLNKKGKVSYDSKSGIILSLEDLYYDEEEKVYEYCD